MVAVADRGGCRGQLALLLVGVGASLSAGRSRVVAGQDAGLRTAAAQQAAVVGEYFERAHAVDLLLAHDQAFSDFYAAPGSRESKVAEGSRLAGRANAALDYLESLYPGRISEACFIDRSGAENARVTAGQVAPLADLSLDEAGNPFFAPTFALPAGQVYQAAPYVSPDTNQWVISNSTPLVRSGRAVAIVHFEIGIYSFREELRRAGAQDAQLVDTATGRVVVDTRHPQLPGRALGSTAAPALLHLLGAAPEAGTATIDGRRIAFQPLTAAPSNANRWTVVVSAPPVDTGWLAAVGAGPIALLLGALPMLGFVLFRLRARQRQLRDAGLHDPLTGLPNRTLLADRVGQALRGGTRAGTATGLLLIDLDRFKEINDTFGHHYGDGLLVQVGARLSGSLRKQDTVARLGGDEFAVLLPGVANSAAACAVASKLRAALETTAFVVEGVALDVEASIGIAVSTGAGADPGVLLQQADVAMYVAKEQNLGVCAYRPDLDGHSPTKVGLLGDLRRAIEHQELVLHYQPKVSVSTGEVVGAEALVRWQHPDRGLIFPGAFIPQAEHSGLLGPLTRYVLDAALAQARVWIDADRPLMVAVNLSARSLLDETLPALVAELLTTHRVAADLLELEVTESAIMTEPARARRLLTALADLGVHLSLDDFGAGYTSLGQLKTLPITELKIDKSFVLTMTSDPSNRLIVSSVVNLGHNLGLTIVAEGVETEQALRYLAGYGCDVAQGYHLSRPIPADAFNAWYTQRAPPPGEPVAAQRATNQP